MFSTLSGTQKGILYALFGFSTFVISDSCAKWLSSYYPVMMIVGWTYVFSLMFGIVCSPLMGGLPRTLRTGKIRVHLGRGVFNFGLAITVVTAFQHLPLTSVYPVLFLAPFIITLMAWPIYGEAVKPVNWLVILIGFSGVVIAFQPWRGEVNPWIISAFLCMFCISGLSLLARPLDQKETLLSLSFYPNVVNVAFLFTTSLFVYPLPAPEHLPVFMLGGVMLTCGMSGVASACRVTRYAIVVPLQYTQLILVFMIGYFVFGERPDGWMIAGSLVIAASGLLLVLSKKQPIVTEH